MSHELLRFIVSTAVIFVQAGIFLLIVRKAKKSFVGVAGIIALFTFLFVYFALIPLPELDHRWGPEPFAKFYFRDILIRTLPIWFWIPGGVLIVYKGVVRPLMHLRENSPAKAAVSAIIGWVAGVPIAFGYWLTQ